MKNSGFQNEQKIINYLQNKRFSELNKNFKKIINKSPKKIGTILCQQGAGDHINHHRQFS